MSITTTIDRSGVHWVKFNSVYAQLNGDTLENAARELQNAVSVENIRDYQQLDLDDIYQIKSEHDKSKFINNASVVEYINRNNAQNEKIDNIITKLDLLIPNDNTNVAVYYESLKFYEEDVHIKSTFCVLRVFGKIWIEAVKLCYYFNYTDPWGIIRKHITAENKSTVENLHQTNGSSNKREILMALGNQLKKPHPNLLLINEDGIVQLSQYSRKPILKRFLANMYLTLSKRYNMVLDVKQDVMLAVPKTSKRKMDENIDDDAGQTYKVHMLDDPVLGIRVKKKTSDVDLSKETLIAFIWISQENPCRKLDIFSMVCQKQKTFDKKYKFIKTNADSKVMNRVTNKELKHHKNAKTIIIGKEFVSSAAKNDWICFKTDHRHMMFGIEFVNQTLTDFTILTKDDLIRKYNFYRQFKKIHYNPDSDYKLSHCERIIIKYNLFLFYKINILNVNECLNRCFVPDIWSMYRCLDLKYEIKALKLQIKRMTC